MSVRARGSQARASCSRCCGGMRHGRTGHRRAGSQCAARHLHLGRGGDRRHRDPGSVLRQDPHHLRRLPPVQRRGRRPRQPGRRLLDSGGRRHGRAHRIRHRRRRAAHRARPAALRPPPGLSDLRAGRRLPAAGVLLPLRRRAHQLRQGRHQELRARRRQPPHPARPEQVHPVRQVRARLRRGPGHQRRRLRRPWLRLDGDHVVRPPPEQGLLPLLRAVRRHVPHRRPGRTSSSRVRAAGTAPRCAPPARSAVWAATST